MKKERKERNEEKRRHMGDAREVFHHVLLSIRQ